MSTRWLRRIQAWFGSPYAVPLGIVLLSLVIFANSVSNGFVLDDRSLVERNPLIRRVERIPVLFKSDYWAPKLRSGLYRPIVTTSYALNYAVGGRDPRGYHLANVAMHALLALLVWALYRRVTGDPLVAAGAGFLFAAHAVHTEVVANVAGRAELLGALFFLISLLLVLRPRGAPGTGLDGRYAASLGVYLVALLSKESAVTLVGVLFLYDFLYGPDGGQGFIPRLWETLRERWPIYSGFVLMTLVYLGIRSLALGNAPLPPLIQMDNPLVTLDLPWRIVNALQVLFRYLWVLCFPLYLSYDYSYNTIPMIESLADPRLWGLGVLCVATVGLVFWSYRSWRELFFALGFYFITFSVVSNLLVLIGTIMGERLVYVPSVGFCLAVVLVLRALCSRLVPGKAQIVFVTVCALVVGLNAARSIARNPDWESLERLYLHDLEILPNSAKAANNAAAMLWGKRKDHERSLELFERSIRISPQYKQSYRTAGFVYTELGRDKEAMEMYDKAIRYGATDAMVYNNLGFILVEQGDEVERGVALLERAVEKRPNQPDFLDSLGWGYYKLGRYEDAHEQLVKSLEIDSMSPTAPSRRAHLQKIEKALKRQLGERFSR